MGRSRKSRVAALLGASGVLATVFSGMGTAAQAQPASMQAQPTGAAASAPACVAMEALVSDAASGPGLGGEVLRATPGGVSTLTDDSSPAGGPDLDYPSGMAFLPDGDIVITDKGHAAGPVVMEVDPATGDRTVLSDDAAPAGGQQFSFPVAVTYNACEKAFYVLQTGLTSSGAPAKVLKVDAVTGTRKLLAKVQGADNYAMLLRPVPVGLPPPVPAG
jgi:hypothetical protein